MRPALTRRSAIIIARAVLTVLVLAAVAPRSAEANCSLYVQTNSSLPKYDLSLAEFDNARVPSETTEPVAPLGSRRRRPCSGALCSGQPASPSSPTQIDMPRGGHWAMIVTPAQAAVPDPVLSPGVENDLHRSHRGTSVYHPPRLTRALHAR
jgi:hypothetical protein